MHSRNTLLGILRAALLLLLFVSTAAFAQETICEPPVIAKIATSRPLPICEGTTVDLIASGGVMYQWSFGDTSQTVTVSSPGTYFVTAYDEAGCSGWDSIVVKQLKAPKISISLVEPTWICPGDSLVVEASPSPNYLWSTGDTTRSIVIRTPGTYYASTKDSNCTGYSLSLKVDYYSVPEKPIIVRYENELLALGSTGPRFQWYRNGKIIPGATSQNISADSEGVYTVVSTNNFGCSTVSDPYVLSFSSVQPDEKFEISVMPNPARQYIELRLSGVPSVSSLSELYDVLGKKVATIFEGIVRPRMTIKHYFEPPLSAGSYILRSNIGGRIYSSRIQIE